MKKLLSTLLAVIMLTMCLGTTGFAAGDLSFSEDSLFDLIDVLDRNMPMTQQRRVEVFDIFVVYAETADSLGTLIGLLDSVTGTGSTVPGGTIGESTLNSIIANVGDSLVANKDAIKLALSVIRALPDVERMAAIDDFKAAQAAVDAQSATDGSWWATENEAGVVLESVNQSALHYVYDSFVGNDGDVAEDGTEKLGTHGIGPNTILRLAKGFNGSLMLTDAAEGSADFAVKEASDAFKDNLLAFVGAEYDSINGTDITTGEDVLNALVGALNGFDDTLKEQVKTVLGAEEIALYEPIASEDEGEVEGDGDGSGDGSTPGVGGSGLGGSKPAAPSVTNKLGDIVPDTSSEIPAPAAAGEAYTYSDTQDHWAQDYVGELTKRGIFNGYADGSFKPDMGITREEIAVALTRALGLTSKARYAPHYSFADSSFISLWAADSVNMMVKEGVFEGYDDGEYKPQRIITREEMVAVIMRMFTSDLAREELVYVDEEHIGDWAREYLEKATNLSIVGGYPDGTFRPDASITRGEAAKILYNFMHYAGLL